jgi:four helix bundle protein
MNNVENLRIYKKALELVGKIYQLIKNNSELIKDFSLCDQLKRASISVITNIAEGYFRRKKQSHYYLEIASGSCNETVSLLQIVELVYKINTKNLQEEYKILGKQINSFSKTFD